MPSERAMNAARDLWLAKECSDSDCPCDGQHVREPEVAELLDTFAAEAVAAEREGQAMSEPSKTRPISEEALVMVLTHKNCQMAGLKVSNAVCTVHTLCPPCRSLAEEIDAFVAEAVAVEREACARIADRADQSAWGIAREIRARSKP